jgi:hypothetical protein
MTRRKKHPDDRLFRVVAITRADGRTFLLTSVRRRNFLSAQQQKFAAEVLRARWAEFVDPADSVKVITGTPQSTTSKHHPEGADVGA